MSFPALVQFQLPFCCASRHSQKLPAQQPSLPWPDGTASGPSVGKRDSGTPPLHSGDAITLSRPCRDEVRANPSREQTPTIYIAHQAIKIAPHQMTDLIWPDVADSSDGVFHGEHVAGAAGRRRRSVAVGMVGFGEKPLGRDIPHDLRPPEHRSVDREIAAGFDRAFGRSLIALPPRAGCPDPPRGRARNRRTGPAPVRRRQPIARKPGQRWPILPVQSCLFSFLRFRTV